MPVQIPPRIRHRLIAHAGVIVTAVAALAGCESATEPATADPTTTTAARAAAPSSGLQGFIARPRQHLLFTAKPSASPAEAEAFFKDKILPVLASDARIGNLATYVDANGAYLIELELRTTAPAQFSLALDVLSVGRSQRDAEKLLRDFSRYFDAASAQQLVPRADLSLTRHVIGTVEGGK